MCGATDCRSCGPAQGYAAGPEDEDDEDAVPGIDQGQPFDDFDDGDFAADKGAADYEAELDARATQ
jgi:hypothetical protein